MITDEEFDQQMHALFHQLGERISTTGDPLSVLDRRSTPSVSRRGRWVGLVAAASLVGVGVAALATRDGQVRRVSPAVAADGVDDSVPTVETVAASLVTTVPPTQPAVTEQSTTSVVPSPQDPYSDVATMLQAAEDISYRAMVKAVTACMLGQGYTYQSVPDPTEGFFSSELTALPWNTPSPDRASARGYLQPRQGDPVVNPDGDTGFGTKAYQHALYGDVVDNWELGPGETVPDGFAVGGPIMDGCRPEAQIEIVGDGDPRAANRIGDYFGQLQIVEVQARMEITSTPDYARLITAWTACMSDHGYHYTDPEQPRRQAWTGQRPGAEEIATATQDASCKTDVGLTQFGDHLFNKMVSDWFVQHPGRLAEISEYVQGVTDRANAILSG